MKVLAPLKKKYFMFIYINFLMNSGKGKEKTRSFAGVNTPVKSKREKFGYSPEKSEGRT